VLQRVLQFLQWYCTGERLERLLRHSLATGDELAWKLLHNLAVAGGQQAAQRLLVQAQGMLDLLQVSAKRLWLSRQLLKLLMWMMRKACTAFALC
jgi:hypothetical protein